MDFCPGDARLTFGRTEADDAGWIHNMVTPLRQALSSFEVHARCMHSKKMKHYYRCFPLLASAPKFLALNGDCIGKGSYSMQHPKSFYFLIADPDRAYDLNRLQRPGLRAIPHEIRTSPRGSYIPDS